MARSAQQVVLPGGKGPKRPPYLFATLSDGGRELTDYHVHTPDARLFELLHLLFHCGFKSEVRCEEARPVPRVRRWGQEAEQPRGWVGSRGGAGVGAESESQARPGGGGKDGTGMGTRERHRHRERERTEDKVSMDPGTLYPHPPGPAPSQCFRCPQEFCGYGWGSKALSPCHTRVFSLVLFPSHHFSATLSCLLSPIARHSC